MQRLLRPAFSVMVLAAALGLASVASAQERWSAYDAKAFSSAQKQGKTIFVHVHAEW